MDTTEDKRIINPILYSLSIKIRDLKVELV